MIPDASTARRHGRCTSPLPLPLPPGETVKRFAEFVLGHRLIICLTWLVLLVAGGATAGVQLLRDGGIGTGVLTPIEVLVPSGEAEAAAGAAADLDGIRTAVVGADNGETAIVDVIPDQETVDSDGTAVVGAVRSALEGATSGEVGVGGAGAAVEDYASAVYDRFPYVLLLIAAITFMLLVRTFRSILLPIKGPGRIGAFPNERSDQDARSGDAPSVAAPDRRDHSDVPEKNQTE